MKNPRNNTKAARIYEIRCGVFDIKQVGKVLKAEAYAKQIACQSMLQLAREESDKILQAANDSREEILDQAKIEAKKIVDEAKKTKKKEEKKGYLEGLEKGKHEIANAMMDFVAKSAQSFTKLEADVTEVVKMALRKIIGKLDKTELIVSVVKTSLQKIKMQKQATLKVSSADAQILRERVTELTSDTPVLEFLDVSTDNHLQPGACILETELGVIDASVEVQLNAIEEALSKFKS